MNEAPTHIITALRPLPPALQPTEPAAKQFAELWQHGQSPDWQEFLKQLGPFTRQQRLAVIRVDVAERWRRGESMPVETYFRRDPELAKDAEAVLRFADGLRGLLPGAQDTEVLTTPARQPDIGPAAKQPPTQNLALGRQPETIDGDPALPLTGDWLQVANLAASRPASTAESMDLHRVVDPAPTRTTGHSRGGDIEPPLPPRIGKYEVVRELGRGGMGVVYEALDTQLKRPVALKMILAAKYADAAALRRFRTEAEAVARLKHPNIVQIHEIGTEDGRPFFAFELLSGGTLHSVMMGKPQPPATAAAIIAALARAMHHAHSHGIIHRDLKPANILLEAGDVGRGNSAALPAPSTTHPVVLATHAEPLATNQLKISDFGLAKHLDVEADRAAGGVTRSGDVIGTPSYMAPEQIERRFGAVGPLADVYSLGAILYELLTGRPPFEGTTPLDTLLHVTHLEPVPPTRLQPRVPRDLETICLKCLNKEPPRRYATALNLADDLQRFQAGKAIEARPLSHLARLGRWGVRNPVLAGLCAAVLLLLVLATAGSLIAAFKIEAARDREERQRLRAQEQAAASRQAAIKLQVTTGVRHLEKHDLARALPWFAEALKMAEGDPAQEERHRRRLAAVIRRYPKLTQVWLHEAALPQAALSPDGRMAVTVSADGTARFWDTATGDPLMPPLPFPVPLELVTFSPKGKYAAIAGGDHSQKKGLAWIYDVAARKLINPPVEHASMIPGASFSDDEQLFATGSWDDTARVWDARTGQPRTAPLQHPSEVWEVTFRPGTHQLFTLSNNLVRIWDGDTGQLLPISLKHADRVEYICFSADGRFVSTGSVDGTAQVWNAETGQPAGQPIKLAGMAKVAHITPDGRRVITSSGEAVRVWDAQSGQPLTPPMKSQAAAFYIGLSADARRLVTGSGEIAQVWDTFTGEPLSPPLKHNGIVHSVAFLPDGHRILTACGNSAQIWDLAAGETPVQLLLHGAPVVRGFLAPDGKRAITLGQDWSVRAWDTAKGASLWTNGSYGPMRRGADANPGGTPTFDAAFSPDGERVIIAMGDQARVWSVPSGKALTPSIHHPGGVEHVAFSRDGRLVATGGADHIARVWNAASGDPVTPPLQHGGRVVQVGFSNDSRFLATGSEDHAARIWDATSGKLLCSPLKHGGFVGTVRFSPDDRLLLTAGADRMAMIWDVATGVAVCPPLKHLAFARDAVFSPDGQFVATCSYDQTARVWRVANGQAVTPPLKHNALVDQVFFSQDSRWVATVSRDRVAQVWETATGDPLTPPLVHGGLVHAAIFDQGGAELVTLSGDAMIRRWPLDLSPPPRSVNELVLHANILDGHYIDATGGFMPLDSEALHGAWQRLRSAAPNDFRCSAAEAAAWHGRRAAELALRGQWDGVIQHLDVVLQVKPGRAADWRLRGLAHAELGHREPAAADLAKALQLGAADSEITYQLGLLSLANGDEEHARNCAQILLTRFQSDGSSSTAHCAARLAALMGRHDTTWPPIDLAAETALTAEPKNLDYLLTRSLVLGRLERWQETLRLLEPQLQAADAGSDPLPWLIAALAHRGLGHVDAARAALTKAEKLLDYRRSEPSATRPWSWQRELEMQILKREANGK